MAVASFHDGSSATLPDGLDVRCGDIMTVPGVVELPLREVRNPAWRWYAFWKQPRKVPALKQFRVVGF